MAFSQPPPVAARLLRTLSARASPRRRERVARAAVATRAATPAPAPAPAPARAPAPTRAPPLYSDAAADSILTRCCERIDAADEAEVLRALCRQLVDASATSNLTAVRDYAGAVVLHAADALSVVPALDEALGEGGGSVVDIGAGAGFPGLPVAAARRRWRIVLLEATRKKVAFQRAAAAARGLANAEPLWARAEDVCRGPRRAAFHAATARAVARLDVLAELALPLLRVGGVLVAQKSLDPELSEVAAAHGALTALGGRVEAVVEAFSEHVLRDVAREHQIVLPPGDGRKKSLVVIRKVHATPHIFPRSFNAIKRDPL